MATVIGGGRVLRHEPRGGLELRAGALRLRWLTHRGRHELPTRGLRGRTRQAGTAPKYCTSNRRRPDGDFSVLAVPARARRSSEPYGAARPMSMRLASKNLMKSHEGKTDAHGGLAPPWIHAPAPR